MKGVVQSGKRMNSQGNRKRPTDLESESRYQQKDSGMGFNTLDSSMEDPLSGEETDVNSQDWNLLNKSPPSGTLITQGNTCGTQGNINSDFEQLSLHNSTWENTGVQTDLVFPHEDGDIARRTMAHVQLLRGLLCARQYDIESSCKKKLKFDELLETSNKKGGSSKRLANTQYKRRNKVIDKQSRGNYELIDLVSPESKQPSSGPKVTNRGAEALRFALRHTNQESEVLRSLKTVADYVCNECINHTIYVHNNWTGSLLELAVDSLLRVTDAESYRSSRILVDVCQKLVDEIVQNKNIALHSRLECLSNMILKLCDNQLVALGVVGIILSVLTKSQKMFSSKKFNLMESSPLLENLHHLLRILTVTLQNLEHKFDETGVTPGIKSIRDDNILNLWRNHYRPMGEEGHPAQRSAATVQNSDSSWSNRLSKVEDLVKFSLERAPLMAPFLLQALQSVRNIHIKDSV